MENDGAYIDAPILTVPSIILFGRGAAGGAGSGRRFFSRFLVTPVLGVTPPSLGEERSAQELFKTASKDIARPILIATLL